MAETHVGEQLAFSPDDAARRLGLGHTTIYRLIREGQIRSVKVGRRRLLPLAEIHKFLEAN